jgi:hypothetical protein
VFMAASLPWRPATSFSTDAAVESRPSASSNRPSRVSASPRALSVAAMRQSPAGSVAR